MGYDNGPHIKLGPGGEYTRAITLETNRVRKSRNRWEQMHKVHRQMVTRSIIAVGVFCFLVGVVAGLAMGAG